MPATAVVGPLDPSDERYAEGPGAIEALDAWIAWAQRSRSPAFVRLSRCTREHRTTIIATIEHRLTNALVESFNTKIRLIA